MEVLDYYLWVFTMLLVADSAFFGVGKLVRVFRFRKE